MATYRVLFWKTIPSAVEAEEADGMARVLLSQRFQDLIDAVAMRGGASAADAYLDGWHHGPANHRPGGAQTVAEAVAMELEGSFEEVLRKILLLPSA